LLQLLQPVDDEVIFDGRKASVVRRGVRISLAISSAGTYLQYG
jgi:hypothetical protein